jgi:hypothetical protein
MEFVYCLSTREEKKNCSVCAYEERIMMAYAGSKLFRFLTRTETHFDGKYILSRVYQGYNF